MITTRFMELRKRRGLMAALLVVNVGLPVIFLSVRLIAHAVAPKSYGPAGGYSIFNGLVVGALFWARVHRRGDARLHGGLRSTSPTGCFATS